MEALARMGPTTLNSEIDSEENSSSWLPDSNVHKIKYSRCEVNVFIEPEENKININKVPPEDLKRTLEAMNIPHGVAVNLTDRILDFIDPDSALRTNGAEKEEYLQMGLNHLPSNAPLDELEELLLVPGINWNLFWKGSEKNIKFPLLPGKNSLFSQFSIYSSLNRYIEPENRKTIRSWKNGMLYRIVSGASCGDCGKVVMYCIVELQIGQKPHYRIKKIKEII